MPSNTNLLLASLVRLQRESKGLTQAEAGELVGRNQKWQHDRETGAVRLKAEDLIAMSRAWGLDYATAMSMVEKEERRIESRAEATG